jgi:hypothetical protein
MIEKYVKELDGFSAEEARTAMNYDRFKILYDFLENKEQIRLYVWIQFEAPFEMQFDFNLPPKFDPGKRFKLDSNSSAASHRQQLQLLLLHQS